MNKIIKQEKLAENLFLLEVEAPQLARKAKAGQFVIVRISEKGERIPLTIADYDLNAGTITLIFQVVGLTTKKNEFIKNR